MGVFEDRSNVPEGLRRRIEHEFFLDAAIALHWEQEGQTITNGRIQIGGCAGPWCTASSLHFPERFIYDRMCIEPLTLRMTERELRVMAFQANVLEHLRVPSTASELVESLRFMPDFTYVPLEDGTTAWGDTRSNGSLENGSGAMPSFRHQGSVY